jgi:hypothetical protein
VSTYGDFTVGADDSGLGLDEVCRVVSFGWLHVAEGENKGKEE